MLKERRMDRRRIISLALLAVCAASASLILLRWLGPGAERRQVRARYTQLRQVMRARDTNSITLLFLPVLRARSTNEIGRLQIFAHDLGASSSISINGTQAWICPRRELPFIPFLRNGHEIEMMRVEDEWYLTGRISIW